MRWAIPWLALLLCGCGPKPITMEDFNTVMVRFPSGKEVRAEVMQTRTDMMRGMMFRDSLPPDRGMLFIHSGLGNYTYYMYQVRIPLDIMWMNRERRIVEMVQNVPPCKTRASDCPQYGGHERAMFVLELGGGMAAKYGLKVGDTLSF